MIYKFFKGHLIKESKLFWTFLCLSIASPLIAIFVPIRPDGIDLENWFSRSGAAMVVFALFAEAKAIRVSKMLNASGFRTKEYEQFIQDHRYYSVYINKLAFILLGVGTFIWGFGDLCI